MKFTLHSAWIVILVLIQISALVYGNLNSTYKDGLKALCDMGCICSEAEQGFEFLDCGYLNISHLPHNISFHPEVTGVTFEHNHIKNVTSKTFINGSHITHFDLSSNQLTVISNYSFLTFNSLEFLRLSENNLSQIPLDLLEGLKNLRVLDMGHNQIIDLSPMLFKSVMGLQELRLEHNNLRHLHANTFKFLPMLEKLDLDHNGLFSIPNNVFISNPRLHWLSLQENFFTVVPGEALNKIPALNSLDLSGNNFVTLPYGAFSSMSNLSLLNLNYMKRLVRIEKGAFHNLTHLKKLSCSFNSKLSFIHPEAFVSNCSSFVTKKLPTEQLYLRSNGLKTLPPPVHVDTWSEIDFVDLRDNPWRCDCRIRWMTKLKPLVTAMVRCDTPVGLHGRTISSLKLEDMTCDDPWMFSTIILVITSLVAFTVCAGIVLAVACSKSSMGLYIRSKGQFTYSKVMSKRECLDLEWDPSADS